MSYVPRGLTSFGIKHAGLFLSANMQKMSANKALKWFQSMDLGRRKTDFLKDFKQYNIAQNGWNAIIRMPKHNRISKDYFVTPKSTVVNSRYAYVVKGTIHNNKTGAERPFFETLGSNILETKKDMITRAENDLINKYGKDDEILIKSNVVQVYRGNKI